MNKIERIISKWNFKKIAIIYIASAFIVGIGCTAAVGIIFKERISFAWQYASVSELAEEKNPPGLQEKIDKLASSASDVVDVLVLDNENQVLYSAKNSRFARGPFNLSKSSEDNHYLVSDIDSNIVFKYVKGDEFMFTSVFHDDLAKIIDEYDSGSFFEYGFSNKTVYMISYLGEKDSGNKIYIINNPTSVTGGMFILKITASAAMFFFMLYWVLLAVWVWQDAAKAKLYPLFWGVIVLFTNIAGVMIYHFYKHGNVTCPNCSASNNNHYLYCPDCGTKLGGVCEKCGHHVSKKQTYCPYCGAKNKTNS